MASERVGPDLALPGGVVATEFVGPTFPLRDRIVEAMRAVDDGLAGDPDAGLARVPSGAVVRAAWIESDQGAVSEIEATVCRVHHLRTLLELGLAYLARGEEPPKLVVPTTPEAPHAG